eukprot:6448246-Prymnesium_polylepis.1
MIVHGSYSSYMAVKSGTCAGEGERGVVRSRASACRARARAASQGGQPLHGIGELHIARSAERVVRAAKADCDDSIRLREQGLVHPCRRGQRLQLLGHFCVCDLDLHRFWKVGRWRAHDARAPVC